MARHRLCDRRGATRGHRPRTRGRLECAEECSGMVTRQQALAPLKMVISGSGSPCWRPARSSTPPPLIDRPAGQLVVNSGAPVQKRQPSPRRNLSLIGFSRTVVVNGRLSPTMRGRRKAGADRICRTPTGRTAAYQAAVDEDTDGVVPDGRAGKPGRAGGPRLGPTGDAKKALEDDLPSEVPAGPPGAPFRSHNGDYVNQFRPGRQLDFTHFLALRTRTIESG